MKVDITIKGLDVFVRNKNKFLKHQEANLLRALHESALVVQSEARRLVIKGPKTGRLYKRGKKIAHRASAPGEAPASDTGTLVRGIVSGVDRVKVQGYVTAQAHYAPHLEKGTKRMKARPFLSAALKNKRKAILGIINARLKR